MSIEYPSGGPNGRWREIIDRLLASGRAAIHDAAATVEAAVRHYRPRLAETARRMGDRFAEAGGAVWRPIAGAVARVGSLARRAATRVEPAVRRGYRAIRRWMPDPRYIALAGTIALAVSWVLWERCGVTGCPDVDGLTSYQPGGASVLLDDVGEQFAVLAPVEHQIVSIDSLPPYVPAAFVAVEDRRFYRHRGIDWLRVLGALWADIAAGRLAEGSSTIPMQLSRNLFPDRIRARERTIGRKLLEARMAMEIEERFTKREILELYLNHIYFGGGARGIEAAARYYFDTSAKELELHQAALLAALPKAPADYDPRERPERARARRDLVLALMARQERVDSAAAAEAAARDLAVTEDAEPDPDGDVIAPYFVQHVRRMLEDTLGQRLYETPLRIFTTLEREAQAAAEEELALQLDRVEEGWYGRYRGGSYGAGGNRTGEGPSYVQGAVVIMDVRTGDVSAWVGGRDFDHSRYDRAKLARRQAGSAFKPFVYAAALEEGLVASQMILDAPYRLPRRGAPDWTPENYSGGFEGRMSMREALVRSQNIPAIRLAAATGESEVVDLARRAGIRGEVPESPVLALGVTAVSPVELAVAFSGFAGQGVRSSPRFVRRVEDREGNVLWSSRPERTRVMDPGVAYILTDMLRDVVDRGTGAAVRRQGYWGPAAGKTGTTSDNTDVWFVGYTPVTVGAVWVGFDDVRSLPYSATGGAIAAPVWGRVFARIGGGRPAWPDRPPGVVARAVDGGTGRLLEEGCYSYGGIRRELFLEGTEPPTTCPRHPRRGFGRLSDFFRDLFGGRPDSRFEDDADPDLGVPRLPRGESVRSSGSRRRDSPD